MTEKIMLHAKYRKGAMRINKDSLPMLRHVPKDFIVSGAEILAAGQMLVDGEPREFQDIRVQLKNLEWMSSQ